MANLILTICRLSVSGLYVEFILHTVTTFHDKLNTELLKSLGITLEKTFTPTDYLLILPDAVKIFHSELNFTTSGQQIKFRAIECHHQKKTSRSYGSLLFTSISDIKIEIELKERHDTVSNFLEINHFEVNYQHVWNTVRITPMIQLRVPEAVETTLPKQEQSSVYFNLPVTIK
jgi:hypothetical protein